MKVSTTYWRNIWVTRKFELWYLRGVATRTISVSVLGWISSTKLDPKTRLSQDLDNNMYKWNKNECTSSPKLSNQDAMETSGQGQNIRLITLEAQG